MPKCNIFSSYLLSESPLEGRPPTSLGEYTPQVVPAQNSREVAPLMRHQSPVPNSQARGNGRKRSVYTVDCLVRFRNRYIDRFRLSQNGPPERPDPTRSIPSLRAVYGTVAQWAERAGNGWTSRWFESSQCQYMSLPSA